MAINMLCVGPTDELSESAVAHAFAGFYAKHYGAVLAFAVRRIDEHETAREIALDVFRVAWAEFGVGPEPTRACLFQVARNQIGDAYRRRDRDRRLRTALEGEAVLDRGAVPIQRVRDVLDVLPSNMREVLVLTYWDGMTAAEIGRILGCTTAAVWVRLHRARAAFAAAWMEET